MKFLVVLALLCLGVSAYDDGSWKGEGLAESQDFGNYYGSHLAYGYGGLYGGHYGNVYAYGAAPIGHDGRVVDTPEVAHAKSAHFAAYNAAAHGSHNNGYYGAVQNLHYGAPLGHDGRVVDTVEVAHAKAAHFAAYNAAAHGAHAQVVVPVYAAHYAGAYSHGAAPLGHDGRVVDTAEVAHAKAAHFAAHSAASHGAAHNVYYGAVQNAHYGAAPLGHDGRVVDTVEVAHAKAAHFAAYNAAAHGTPASSYGPVYATQYAGAYHYGAAPLAHDGRVVDTAEVAHAKAAHFAAYNAAASAASSHGDYYGHEDYYHY